MHQYSTSYAYFRQLAHVDSKDRNEKFIWGCFLPSLFIFRPSLPFTFFPPPQVASQIQLKDLGESCELPQCVCGVSVDQGTCLVIANAVHFC